MTAPATALAAPAASTLASATPETATVEQPQPTADAWKNAPVLAAKRAVGIHSSACKIRQLGHWYNVRCAGLATSALTQLGGAASGVYFKLDPAADDGLPREGEMTFSLREGESRVLSFWTFGEGYDGPLTVIAAVVVQARRHAGSTSVLLHDALDQPIRTAQSELRRAQKSSLPNPSPGKTDKP